MEGLHHKVHHKFRAYSSGEFTGCTQGYPPKLPSISRSLLRILSHQDAPNIRPVRLMHVFHFLGTFPSGNLRGVLVRKAAISFQEFAGM